MKSKKRMKRVKNTSSIPELRSRGSPIRLQELHRPGIYIAMPRLPERRPELRPILFREVTGPQIGLRSREITTRHCTAGVPRPSALSLSQVALTFLQGTLRLYLVGHARQDPRFTRCVVAFCCKCSLFVFFGIPAKVFHIVSYQYN